jgi:hypothetical protein
MSSPSKILIGLSCVLLGLIPLGACYLVISLGVSPSSPSSGVGDGKASSPSSSFSSSSPRVYPRSSFEKLVLGRPLREVRKILGDPDEVIDDVVPGQHLPRQVDPYQGSELWQYNRRTIDPKTGQPEDYVLLGTNRAGGGVVRCIYSGDPPINLGGASPPVTPVRPSTPPDQSPRMPQRRTR